MTGQAREVQPKRKRLPWKWILGLCGAATLVLTFVLARASFESKDEARRRAGQTLETTRDAVSRHFSDFVRENAAKLVVAQPSAPPAPFERVWPESDVLGVTETDSETIYVPSPDGDAWATFSREDLKIWRRFGPSQIVAGSVPLSVFEARLAADPDVGPSNPSRFARVEILDQAGYIYFTYPRPEESERQTVVASKVAVLRIRDGQAPADVDALPQAYKDVHDKRVRATWARTLPGSPRLWTLVEVRDDDIVGDSGGVALEFFGKHFGYLMVWHLTLGLGLLLCVGAAFFWLPAKGGTEVSVLLRTFSFAKPYAWGIAGAVLVGAVYGGSRAYRAIIAKSLVDDVFVGHAAEAEKMAAVWRTVWMTVGLGVVTAVSNYFKEYLQNFFATAMMADVRIAVARKIVSLPLSFFNRFRHGELLARIERDVSGMRQVLMQVFDKAFVAPFVLVAAIVTAFVINWALAFVLFGLPLILIPVFRIAKKVKKRATKRQTLVAEISHVLFQMLTGIKVVKAFHGEEREAKRLDTANRRYIHEARRISRLMAFSESLLDFLQMVGGAAVVYLGGRGVIEGRVEAGDLVGFIFVIVSIYDAAKDITGVLNKMTDALPAVARVYEILDIENELRDGTREAPSGSLVRGIELRGVKFKYRENEILKGIDLTIPAGKVVAIVGPTGAGKTTLCDLVVRFYDPTEGAVLWDGVDAREYTLGSLTSKFAIVTQDAFLFNAPIDENIRYGRVGATQAEVEAAARDANVHDEIELMEGGYSKFAGERGSSLSGGQRQRVTIARALVKDAPVLVLDEATSNLDSHSEKRVQAALAKLMQGRTTIVVAHRLSTIRNADKVVVVDDGRIVEEGAPDDLLKIPGGRFRAMYDLQTGGGAGG